MLKKLSKAEIAKECDTALATTNLLLAYKETAKEDRTIYESLVNSAIEVDKEDS